MPKAEVNDVEVYYETRGEGSPLTLINGWGGSARAQLILLSGDMSPAVLMSAQNVISILPIEKSLQSSINSKPPLHH